MSRLGFGLLLILSCAATGCGDDDSSATSSGSCEAFSACGGDVVGDWEVQDVCFENPEALFSGIIDEPACEGAFRGLDVSASGTYNFGADGTGSSSVTLDIELDTRWTEACISALANGASVDIASACEALQDQYQSQPEFMAASCSVTGSACDCLLSTPERMVSSSGDYRVEGDAIVDADGNAPFCVQGDTLTLSITSSGLTGNIVLSRR